VFAVRDIVTYAILAGAAAALVLAGLPPMRRWGWPQRRWAIAGLATTGGFIAWNLTLDAPTPAGSTPTRRCSRSAGPTPAAACSPSPWPPPRSR
jgi:hypothetical protein